MLLALPRQQLSVGGFFLDSVYRVQDAAVVVLVLGLLRGGWTFLATRFAAAAFLRLIVSAFSILGGALAAIVVFEWVTYSKTVFGRGDLVFVFEAGLLLPFHVFSIVALRRLRRRLLEP